MQMAEAMTRFGEMTTEEAEEAYALALRIVTHLRGPSQTSSSGTVSMRLHWLIKSAGHRGLMRNETMAKLSGQDCAFLRAHLASLIKSGHITHEKGIYRSAHT